MSELTYCGKCLSELSRDELEQIIEELYRENQRIYERNRQDLDFLSTPRKRSVPWFLFWRRKQGR